MNKKAIKTDNAPRAIGPYSQGIMAGNQLFLSGQIPINPKSGEVVSGGIEAQTKQVLNNIGSILEEAGASYDNVVKTTVYLTDLRNFGTVNEIYGKYFREPYPARACIEVSGLPKNVLVEIELIAII